MEDPSRRRRASSRAEVDLHAVLTADDVDYESTISNLSLGGALVSSDVVVTIGSRVQVRLRLPGMGELVDVIATVRWRTGDQIGLQFDGLRAREVWALNQYLKEARGE